MSGSPRSDDRRRWDERWRDRGLGPGHPELVGLVTEHASPPGRLLDVAGGASGDALTFARRGWDVTLVDVSVVALELVEAAARDEGLSVRTHRADLAVDALPPGPFGVVVVAHYLQRDLFPRLVTLLADGGVLVAVVATETNLERHPRPGRPFVCAPGELVSLVGDLSIEHHSERWRDNGRHEAWLVARRSAP